MGFPRGALCIRILRTPEERRDSKSAKAIAMDSINAASIAIAHPFKK
jgi:hypothetical protein